MKLKNVAGVTLLVMACLVSLIVLVFSCYQLVMERDSQLYTSLLSGILGMWMGVAMSYIKMVTNRDTEETSEV